MLPISGKGALRPIGGIGSAGAKWLSRGPMQDPGYTPEGTS